jgi:hypothetical protein
VIWSAKGPAREHAVVGTTPNLAARLQAEAANGEVVIAEGTRRLLGTGFIVEAVGKHLLKGHDDPLPLFRVLREELRGRRFVGIRTASMVGREAELAALCTAWQQARTWSGQAVLLTGEAGIGKSSLLHSLVDAIAEDNHRSSFFNARPYAARTRSGSGYLLCRGRCRLQLAIALLDPSGTEMALHCNADMVRAIVGARHVKFLSGLAGSQS